MTRTFHRRVLHAAPPRPLCTALTLSSHTPSANPCRWAGCTKLDGRTFTSHFTRHTSHVTRHSLHVTLQTSHFTRHTSNLTRHTSQVTRHTSHVTRHTVCAVSPCTCWKERGAPRSRRWRAADRGCCGSFPCSVLFLFLFPLVLFLIALACVSLCSS